MNTAYEKQVDKSIYEFKRYMSKERWCSVWNQLEEIRTLQPKSVLEIGPGPGLFKLIAAMIGIKIETLDFDPALVPDHVGSATDLPFDDGTYDVVCAFQMLEHLPYDASQRAFTEMVRVSRRNIVISLPDARPVWRYRIQIPKFGVHDFLVPRPQINPPPHEFDGEHYWEINKRGYLLSRVIADFTKSARLVNTYRPPENPSQRFFIFER